MPGPILYNMCRMHHTLIHSENKLSKCAVNIFNELFNFSTAAIDSHLETVHLKRNVSHTDTKVRQLGLIQSETLSFTFVFKYFFDEMFCRVLNVHC